MKMLLVLLSFAFAANAQDSFAKWWPQFQAAVKASDTKTVVAGRRISHGLGERSGPQDQDRGRPGLALPFLLHC